MRKLDLRKPVLDLDQKPVENHTLAKVLADRLYASTDGDALKYLDWSLKLNSEGVIEVDESDYQNLINFTKSLANLQAGIKGQILRIMLGSI